VSQLHIGLGMHAQLRFVHKCCGQLKAEIPRVSVALLYATVKECPVQRPSAPHLLQSFVVWSPVGLSIILNLCRLIVQVCM
jgi:hypothetical protein